MGKRQSSPDGIYERRNADGSKSFVAQVRLRKFAPVSKSFATRADALAWRAERLKVLTVQQARGDVREDLPKLTIKRLVEEFLADPETKTLKYYDDLERLLGWWVSQYPSERVLDFGVQKLRAARAKLLPKRKPATVNRHISAMRRCWNWGREAELVPLERHWPTSLMLTEPKGRVRYLTDGELSALLAAAEAYSPTMKAMVVISIATGMRQGELLRLTWADVDLEKATATLRETKNGEARTVHLPSSAIAALKSLRRETVVSTKAIFLRADGTPFDKSILEYHWRELRKKAKLADFRWHDLRHTAASYLAQNGATLLEIGSVLGHKSPSVTHRYSHLVEGKAVTGHAALDEKLGGGKGAK